MTKHILYTLISLIIGFVIGFYCKGWLTKDNVKEEPAFQYPGIRLNNIPENNSPKTISPDTSDLKKEYRIQERADEFGPV